MPEPFELEYVERGLEAAIQRAKPFGLLKDPNGVELTPQQRKDLRDLLSKRLEETGISRRGSGQSIRWNMRAIQLIAEVLGIGILARRHHGFKPMTDAEIDAAIKNLGADLNSFRHRD